MSLCEFISEVAAILVRERSPMSTREAYLSFVLQGMPYFRDVRRLDLWETAYIEVAPREDPSQTERLLDELFSLGSYNLYGAFDPEGTRRCYERLREKFTESGHSLPESAHLSDW